jgi:hypothetical protein
MIKLAFFLLTILFCFVPRIMNASIGIDSLRILRDKMYLDYKYERSTMIERTWNKMIELDRKSKELIEADHLIIDQLTNQTNQANSLLLEVIDRLTMEKTLLENEMQIQKTANDRNIFFITLWYSALYRWEHFFLLHLYCCSHIRNVSGL